mgnify:CR=1 FL=1
MFWNQINLQIRIKAKIFKSSKKISDEHFLSRSKKKNALAISSYQSSSIDSYDDVMDLYNIALDNYDQNCVRPEYWGGYSFKPYYFEFWKGDDSRINKRDVYEFINNKWEHLILQP